jgi:peroxiredoxin
MPSFAPILEAGRMAPDFLLPATDGRTYAFSDIKGAQGTVVVFICNHCPYVRAVIGRLARDAADLEAIGVRTVAISSNDADSYPQDSFENMKVFAAQHRLPFPYLYDESQAVARAYGAVCTPDFFGFDASGALRYRGRLDEGRIESSATAKRELFDAMQQIARTGTGPAEQAPSIGCSIKWKAR